MAGPSLAVTPPRHVALVAHSFPPDGTAGVEQYTRRLAHSVQARGVLATIICGRVRTGAPQNGVLREEVEGLDVWGLVQNYPYRDLPEAASDAALDRVFGEVLDEIGPDLVAIQSLQGLSWGFPAVARARGIDVVMHLHDAYASCPSGGQRLHPEGKLCLPVEPRRCGDCFDRHRHREGPLERASRWAARKLPAGVPPDALHRAFGALPPRVRDGLKLVNERATSARVLGLARETQARVSRPEDVDPRVLARQNVVREAITHVRRVVSPSMFLAESMAADGIELGDVAVVPTGVPATRRAPLRDGAGAPLKVLWLGTWVPHKGPHVLAEALARLTDDEAEQVEARAVGPAPFPAYREDVRRLANGRLHVGGPVPAESVYRLLADHDVVVVSSVWAENAPLVALEARAVGRPILASDLGGLVELVEDGTDGLRFPASEAEALASRLRELLDPSRLEALTRSVRPPPSEASWTSAILEAWAR